MTVPDCAAAVWPHDRTLNDYFERYNNPETEPGKNPRSRTKHRAQRSHHRGGVFGYRVPFLFPVSMMTIIKHEKGKIVLFRCVLCKSKENIL